MVEIKSCAFCKHYSTSLEALGAKCIKLNVGLTGLDLILRAKNCEHYENKYQKSP